MNPAVATPPSSGEGRLGSVLMALVMVCAITLPTLWRSESPGAQSRGKFPIQLTSSSFSDGETIPQQYTCDGIDVSPNLRWTTVPARTKSIALTMHDPDAPVDFTHWIAYNIPASTRELVIGASPRAAMPKGSDEGINDFRHLGYGGPCPPSGKPHHYIFTIYALDALLTLRPAPGRRELESAMKQHVIAEGRITGLYQR
jgi:Raf kinase inhibitor-like YbhB/YbcL family protein